MAKSKLSKIILEEAEVTNAKMILKVKTFNNDQTYLPTRGTAQAACDDVKARILENDEIISQKMKNGYAGLYPNSKLPINGSAKECFINLSPQERIKLPTGLFFDIPEGYAIKVHARSGLSLNYGLLVVNVPAIIDSDYTGEVCVILQNIGETAIKIKNYDKIAQIELVKVIDRGYEQVDIIEKVTERGQNGFGSTGR